MNNELVWMEGNNTTSNEKIVTIKVSKPDVSDDKLGTYIEFIKNIADNEEYTTTIPVADMRTVVTNLTQIGLCETSLLLRYHHEKYPDARILFDECAESEWLIKKCLEEPIHACRKHDGFLFNYQPITHDGCRVLLKYRTFIEGLQNLEGDLRSSF